MPHASTYHHSSTDQGRDRVKLRAQQGGDFPHEHIAHDPKAYATVMPIVEQMIGVLGVKPFGEGLFLGINHTLEKAMQVRWKLGDAVSFAKLMNPLWTAADRGQGDDAKKALAALMRAGEQRIRRTSKSGARTA